MEATIPETPANVFLSQLCSVLEENREFRPIDVAQILIIEWLRFKIPDVPWHVINSDVKSILSPQNLWPKALPYQQERFQGFKLTLPQTGGNWHVVVMRLQPYTYQQLHVIWQDEGSTLNPGLGSLITTAGLNQISKLKTSDPDEIVKNPEIADKDIHYFMRETFSKLILRQQSSWYDPFQL